MKQEIIDYIATNQELLKQLIKPINEELNGHLSRHPQEFHEDIKRDYKAKVRGIVQRDLSMNKGIDYETSMEVLEDVDLDVALGIVESSLVREIK